MSSIKIKIKNTDRKEGLAVSKFFGKPTLPKEWISGFNDTTMFFLQINLGDIAKFDKNNKLPHEGFLYFFLDTQDEQSLKCDVRYYKGVSRVIVDDFNSVVPGYEHFVKEVLIEFEEAEDDAKGTKLLGVSSNPHYQNESETLLLQFDPTDPGLGIFKKFKGLYFFFEEENKNDFSKVTLKQ